MKRRDGGSPRPHRHRRGKTNATVIRPLPVLRVSRSYPRRRAKYPAKVSPVSGRIRSRRSRAVGIDACGRPRSTRGPFPNRLTGPRSSATSFNQMNSPKVQPLPDPRNCFPVDLAVLRAIVLDRYVVMSSFSAGPPRHHGAARTTDCFFASPLEISSKDWANDFTPSIVS